MNKFFILNILLCLFLFTSCNNNDSYDNNMDKKVNVSLTPIKNTDVFMYSNSAVKFTSINTITRSVNVNSNMWDYIPMPISDTEKNGIITYIASKPEGVSWPGYTNYFIQHITGAHHIYTYKDFNNALHSMDGTQSMEMLTIIEINDNVQLVNNFNAGKYENSASNNAVLMTNGFKAIYALNEYSSSVIPAWKLFYWNNNYYIGLDYNMHKVDGDIFPDGCYDDWIIKIIPYNEEHKTPIINTINNGSVEVNLSINEDKGNDDYKWSKTSIHVRDTTDFTLFIPVEAEYYCQEDDMFIVQKHYDYMVYNEYNDNVSCIIDGQTITLNINYSTNGITIKSTGINSNVLKYCKTYYDDGLTFEIYNYYNKLINRSQLQQKLNNSVIVFSRDPKEYVNTIKIELDCNVTKK